MLRPVHNHQEAYTPPAGECVACDALLVAAGVETAISTMLAHHSFASEAITLGLLHVGIKRVLQLHGVRSGGDQLVELLDDYEELFPEKPKGVADWTQAELQRFAFEYQTSTAPAEAAPEADPAAETEPAADDTTGPVSLAGAEEAAAEGAVPPSEPTPSPAPAAPSPTPSPSSPSSPTSPASSASTPAGTSSPTSPPAPDESAATSSSAPAPSETSGPSGATSQPPASSPQPSAETAPAPAAGTASAGTEEPAPPATPAPGAPAATGDDQDKAGAA